MSFERYWEGLVASNPSMEDGDTTVHISVSSLRIVLRRAYEKGVDDNAARIDASRKFNDGLFGNGGDLFDSLFGRGGK